jgi:hypothetical protein
MLSRIEGRKQTDGTVHRFHGLHRFRREQAIETTPNELRVVETEGGSIFIRRWQIPQIQRLKPGIRSRSESYGAGVRALQFSRAFASYPRLADPAASGSALFQCVISETQLGNGSDPPQERFGGPSIQSKQQADLPLGEAPVLIPRGCVSLEQVAGERIRRWQRQLDRLRDLDDNLHLLSAKHRRRCFFKGPGRVSRSAAVSAASDLCPYRWKTETDSLRT